MPSLTKILVANRGEVAVRVMRTCKAMGIATVAVYSDADDNALHVRNADIAVRLGPAAARESYLNIERVIDAARRTGADAVHPGYGFLAENADFAQACADAKLTFIGPSADVIRKLGSKRVAKLLALECGVPVVPGSTGVEGDSTAELLAAANKIGFPILVKASAGGGGKGMRVVYELGQLAAALDLARGEAAAAFGDDTLLLERYIERPRHLEIQLLGDTHGNVVHLGERECSIQRRHQKVIEEAPSPTLDDKTRAAMSAAAVRLGRHVGYHGAGTVEFIVAPDGEFYFLEVNTRLQVEHAVTEAVTGLDLVREQIRIARGEPLGYETAPPPRGHAIEVRLCAEDADADHLPRPGRVLAVALDDGNGIRIDSALAPGLVIGGDYDSMVGKIIAHAPTRAEAISRLRSSLRQTWLPGFVNNRAFLERVLAHPSFVDGNLHTHFLSDHAAALAAPELSNDHVTLAALAAVVADVAARTSGGDVPTSFRNVAYGAHAGGSAMEFRLGERLVRTRRRGLRSGSLRVEVDDVVHELTHRDVSQYEGAALVSFETSHGLRHSAKVAVDESTSTQWVWLPDAQLSLVEQPRFPAPAADASAGGLRAPMPSRVVRVLVAVGDSVEPGQTLLVLEAMKMEHPMRAPVAGVIATLSAGVGDQVLGDQLLVTLG